MAQSVFGVGPLLALSLIIIITLATLKAAPHVSTTMASQVLFGTWITLVIAIVYNLLASIYKGPGFVKLKWQPNIPDPEGKLQFCTACGGYKPPRTHHCRECGRCCKMLTHHCFWVNSCVGNDNRLNFLSFVTIVPIGCTYSGVIIVIYLVDYISKLTNRRMIRFSQQPPMVLLSMTDFGFLILGCAFAFGVALGVALLAYIQWKSILTNTTELESWIVEKAASRKRETPFVFPYDVGWRENFRQFVRNSMDRDGYTWKTKEGCTEYTFSQEELAQLQDKYSRRTAFKVVKNLGRFGWRGGYKTVCTYPVCEDQPKLQIGDIVQAWRVRGQWYYGEKVEQRDGAWFTAGPKGWFPIQRGAHCESQ